MTLTKTEHKYVELDERNVPIIAGTTMKVIELVTGQIAYGWSPEELHFQHPYLRMSQIYSALSYYWDHKEELDADIERREQYAEKSRREAGESPLAKKLGASQCMSKHLTTKVAATRTKSPCADYEPA